MPVHKIAFFTNRVWASARTRAHQLAPYLDASVDEPFSMSAEEKPKHIVLVKALPSLDELKLLSSFSTVWFDPIDSDIGLEVVAQVPSVKVMAIGETAEKYLKARLLNEVVLVPEHHCNFERAQRGAWNPQTVGFVGYANNFCIEPKWFEEELKKVGLEFKMLLMQEDSRRIDVVKFYKTIDIQVTFRLPRIMQGMPPEMKNPLKVINAASFGIPTVGFPELAYEEFPVFVEAKTAEDLVCSCQRMKEIGSFFKTALLEKAEAYHVSKAVETYKELLR